MGNRENLLNIHGHKIAEFMKMKNLKKYSALSCNPHASFNYANEFNKIRIHLKCTYLHHPISPGTHLLISLLISDGNFLTSQGLRNRSSKPEQKMSSTELCQETKMNSLSIYKFEVKEVS